MKIGTVLQKILNLYGDESEEINMMIEKLAESCEQTVTKERMALIRKFSKAFDITPEQIESKILPKRKRHITEEKLQKLAELYSKQPIIYKDINYKNNEYCAEMDQYGLIYGTDDEDKLYIAGFMKNDRPYFFTHNL